MDYKGCRLLKIQKERHEGPEEVWVYMERVHPNGYREHIGVKASEFLEDTEGLEKVVDIRNQILNFKKSKDRNRNYDLDGQAMNKETHRRMHQNGCREHIGVKASEFLEDTEGLDIGVKASEFLEDTEGLEEVLDITMNKETHRRMHQDARKYKVTPFK